MSGTLPVFDGGNMFEALFTNKSHVPDKEEQVTMTVRLPLSLRTEFNKLCAKHNITASDAVRDFMKQALEDFKSGGGNGQV